MSELAPGSVSLEDDNPSLESLSQPPPEPEAPKEAPPVPTAGEDADPEGTVVNPGGEKLVPLNVVADLRGKVRETKSALEAKDAEIAALKDKAAKFDQVSRDWQNVQPLLQKLQQQPPQQTPQAPAGPLSQQDAIEYARDLDLFKADGTPDVERAQRLAARQQAIAETQAKTLVQPLYQQTAQQQSAANFERAASFKDKNGVQVDRATLERVWGLMPAEMSANPQIAGVLYKIAKSEMLDAGLYKTAPAPPPPPIVTESLGGNSNTTPAMSDIERNFASAVGMKTKDYESISGNFKPGQRNALE